MSESARKSSNFNELRHVKTSFTKRHNLLFQNLASGDQIASWLPNKKVNFESCSWSLLASVQHYTFCTFFFAYLNFLWTSSSLHSWVAVFFYKIHAAITVADLFDKEGTLIVKEPLAQKKKPDQTRPDCLTCSLSSVM